MAPLEKEGASQTMALAMYGTTKVHDIYQFRYDYK